MIRSYSSLLFWLGLTIAASLMLYHTSDRVTELDQQLRSLNNQISAEQESIHVLKAEWVYLANPARIEAEAQHYLGLHPTAPQRVASLKNMSTLLPVRTDVVPVPAVQTAQADADSYEPAQAETETTAPTHSPRDRVVALNSAHINNHMIMQHKSNAMTVEASTDSIGTLIGTLGLHP
jgi:cell division protein FtsL